MYNKRALIYRIPLWTLASLGMLYLVVHTPLRQYLPGYLDSNKRAAVEESSMRIDSLEAESRLRMIYLENMIDILKDRKTKQELVPFDSAVSIIQDTLLGASERERNFAASYEAQERFGLSVVDESQKGKQVRFLNPLKGKVITPSEAADVTSGVDVKVERETPVMAPLDGTVVAVSFIFGKGYQVVLQHSGDYLTLFSNLTAPMVEAGEVVKCGHVVGHVGGKGLNASQMVNIQIWHKGAAVDPQSVMIFE